MKDDAARQRDQLRRIEPHELVAQLRHGRRAHGKASRLKIGVISRLRVAEQRFRQGRTKIHARLRERLINGRLPQPACDIAELNLGHFRR